MERQFTPEQIEQVDLSDMDRMQRIALAPTLYACAPKGDSLSRRLWVAERLDLPLGVVNQVLWSHGIRWLSPAPKQFTKRGRRNHIDAR